MQYKRLYFVFIIRGAFALHHPKNLIRRRIMDTYILDDYNDQFATIGKIAAFWLLLKIIF